MTEKRNKSINFSNSFSVSLSQCQGQDPSPELLAKYTEMKQTFLLRVNNFHESLLSLMQPVMESPEMVQVQQYLNTDNNRRVNAAMKFLE